jgi:hypothetical protein
MNIGFIGLGIMGAPMALHLRRRRATRLFVHTRGRCPRPSRRSSRHVCTSAAEVARQADVVFIMVPDTPDVEAVLFGERRRGSGLGRAAAAQGRGRHELASRPWPPRPSPEDQRAGCRLHRRAGVRWRGGRQGGVADHHVRRRCGGVRAREAAAGEDGQEHHPGGRQRRWPDHQGGQPDHRGAEHRRRGRGAALCQQGRRRPGQGAPGADGRLCRPAASWKCMANA